MPVTLGDGVSLVEIDSLTSDTTPTTTNEIVSQETSGGSLVKSTLAQAVNAVGIDSVTVADEQTDTTCFPIFSTAATGDLGPKSNANLTFNSSTEELASTLFSGAHNGTVGATTPATGSFTTLGTSGDITLTTANVVVSSGNGVDFSATADATGMTAEILDDYEEGMHTATLVGSTSGNFVLSAAGETLAYTKVGRVVHVQGRLSVTSDNSALGTLRMSLPYTVTALTDEAEDPYTPCAFYNHGGTIVNAHVQVVSGQAYAHFYAIADNGISSAIDEGVLDTGWVVNVNFSYISE